MERGHAPTIKERDIGYAFKMRRRAELFNMDLEDLSAHDLKLIEMIEDEISKMQIDNYREMRRKMNGGRTA